MDEVISGPVFLGGGTAPDVKKVQALLNRVPESWGGPAPKLDEDGAAGPKTSDAIKRFQLTQLGTIFKPDGRVDPRGRTLRRLNHIAQSPERPGAAVQVSGGLVSHIRQSSSNVCWAAAGTMLVAARDRTGYTVEQVLRKAELFDSGPRYLARYWGNEPLGVPPDRFVKAIGLRTGPPLNLTLALWIGQVRGFGPIGAVGMTPSLHIRIVSDVEGDGSVFGTFMTVHDPARDASYKEVFVTFAERVEAAALPGASGEARIDQIWHK